MAMKKGIIFSVDALLALLLVIVLASAIVQHNLPEENAGINAKLKEEAYGRAFLGLYANTASSEGIGSNAKFGECVNFYYIEPDNALNAQAMPLEQKFCEELE